MIWLNWSGASIACTIGPFVGSEPPHTHYILALKHLTRFARNMQYAQMTCRGTVCVKQPPPGEEIHGGRAGIKKKSFCSCLLPSCGDPTAGPCHPNRRPREITSLIETNITIGSWKRCVACTASKPCKEEGLRLARFVLYCTIVPMHTHWEYRRSKVMV